MARLSLCTHTFPALSVWHSSVYVHILFPHYLYGTAQFMYTYFSCIICTAQLSLCTHTFPALSVWHGSVYVHILFLHYLYGTAQFMYTYISCIIWSISNWSFRI